MTFDSNPFKQSEATWDISWLTSEDQKAVAKEDLEKQAKARGFNL